MTELQLRLWCLWMCEEFAGMSEMQAWMSAMIDTDSQTLNEAARLDTLAWNLTTEGECIGGNVSLLAWELSERMP